jgi:hypothetical protein
VWWTIHPESGPKPVPLGPHFFSRPGGVLLRPYHRTIDAEGLGHVTALSMQTFAEVPPDTAGFPASEAVVHRIPVAKLPRQIAPGHARAGHIQDRCDAQAVAQFGRTPRVVLNRTEPWFNRRPCGISEEPAYGHQRFPPCLHQRGKRTSRP